MSPQGKALELIKKYKDIQDNTDIYSSIPWIKAKDCAIICVWELINDTDASSPYEMDRLNYWSKVRQEIEKL